LIPFAQAAFDTAFGRDCTKDMGAIRRRPRTWAMVGAPQRSSAASCADYFPRPKRDNLKIGFENWFQVWALFPPTDGRGRA
jgi:hypothetical protein